jgi:hypothetical protein
MKPRLIFEFAFLTLAAMTSLGSESGKDVAHLSPDRALRARVHTDQNGESSVRIEDTRSGAILLIRDDTSSDGTHGHGVVHGAWTPDSQFFVAGLESTSDHPSWARPIWAYSRATNHVVELWKIGLSVVASFTLRSPDLLQTRVLAPRSNGRRAGQALSVSLRTLLNKDRVQ